VFVYLIADQTLLLFQGVILLLSRYLESFLNTTGGEIPRPPVGSVTQNIPVVLRCKEIGGILCLKYRKKSYVPV
jgi:hypothetical protein